jgi:DNA-binding GntR family transcriptional regulator
LLNPRIESGRLEFRRAAFMPATMTEFIKQDLKARIRAGSDVPDKLTLAGLADFYQVSFTPVRLALQELIDERVLQKQANGRMQVNPDAHSETVVTEAIALPTRPGASHDLEAALADDIIKRSLRGDAEYLREEATAERYGVGRTVLRQALNRLAGQGLVEHLPRRGWRVHPFDEAEMIAYLQVRESLELKALELARLRLDPAKLQRMLKGNRPRHASDSAQLDNDLHRYLIQQAGNRFIRDFFDRHGIYYATLFQFAAPEANVVKAMARQHRAILKALLAKDWRKARQALARHIRAQRPIVERLLNQIGQKEASA